jgi:hypothetical protein
VPARRSRTERWRESLDQLAARSGPIEISVAGENAKSLVWRVRLIESTDDGLVVEAPVTLRRRVPMAEGTTLIGGIAIGQNRWMFHTRVLGTGVAQDHGRQIDVLYLTPPASVERCQRRSFYRISTATLSLPAVQCWWLEDPAAAVPIEVATRAAIVETAPGGAPALAADSIAMPSVGIGIEAVLVNIGGGGACLLVPHADAAALDRPGTFLLRIDLTPTVSVPLPIAARLAHTRIDSSQNVHAGFAFDFSMHRAYEGFVAEQICRYVSELQQGGHRGRSAA